MSEGERLVKAELCGAGLVLRIVLLATNLPVPSFHGFATIGQVALSAVGLLVGNDLREIFLTRLDHACDDLKACTGVGLVRRERCGALVGLGITGVSTVAIRAGGCGGTVGRDDILAVVVSVYLFRFLPRALRVLKLPREFYFCHSVCLG